MPADEMMIAAASFLQGWAMDRNCVESEVKGKVGVIRLADPSTLNAMTVAMIEGIGAALDRLLPEVRAILLTGTGHAFCSGANLLDSDALAARDEPDFGETLESHVNPLLNRLRDLAVPWISVVRGAAAGAGCGLALAGDMVIASETAFFMQAFSRVGLVPDAGSTFLLARTIGRPRALEMMLLGERLPASRALEWGLVNRVVADDELDEAGLALAARLANGPGSLAMTRRLAWSATEQGWQASLELERAMQREAGRSRDAREGIDAFLEKRPAAFVGR